MQEVISKKQYTLKLTPFYFLFTRLHLFVLVLMYILSADLQSFLMFYPLVAFLLYRFAFKADKLSNPYSIFLLEKWSRFSKILRKKDEK